MIDLKIFLVDDDPFYLNLFHQNLKNIGFENIQTFSNGMDCLNALSQNPDIIFLDHNMDSMSGYEVLKKIKRYDPNKNVVIVSAQDNIQVAVDALKYGAFDYIQKGKNEVEKIKDIVFKVHHLSELVKKHQNRSFINKLFNSILK